MKRRRLGSDVPTPRSQVQVSDAVDVAEQGHVSLVRVDDQVGEGLLLLRPPREAAARLVLRANTGGVRRF